MGDLNAHLVGKQMGLLRNNLGRFLIVVAEVGAISLLDKVAAVLVEKDSCQSAAVAAVTNC
jgi:hypothetical protein